MLSAMDPRDLSTLNYFLDVVRSDPRDAAELGEVALEVNRSPELERAIGTIVKAVEGVSSQSDAEQARLAIALQLEDAREEEAAEDEVEKLALGALKRRFVD
jgi:hypothetical protein